MRTKLRSKVTLLFIVCAVLVAIPAVALADQITGDADNDALATPHPNSESATQAPGSTASYDFSAYIKETGNAKDNVFVNPGDYVSVSISRTGDWLASSAGSPGSFTFTGYNSAQGGTIAVTVPCVAAANTSKTMTATLTGTAKNAGADGQIGTADDVTLPADRQLSSGGASITFNYNITASGSPGASCTAPPPPSDTTAPVLNLPGNITAEATGPSGAAVTYSADATDNVDGTIAANCSPGSGSTFALGTTPVNCSATDAAGNTANGSFNVTVVDTTAPSLNLPADITEEATGPNGAAVSFTATANDAVDGSVTVNCTPASGSTFALGTTRVSCSASDAAGNTANGSFTVTVRDTTAPQLTVPSSAVVEGATSASGAVVNFANLVSAQDAVDSTPSIDCTPASGSTFALGNTAVSCTASDDAGNTSAAQTFTVRVQDTTAPTLNNVPSNMNATATSSSGAVVNYTNPTATDAVDPNPVVNCLPASGSTFPVGTTTVSCTATDASNNTSAASTFTVRVAYSWSNFLQPINVPPATQSVFKSGSTVPVKFQLTGASSGITDGKFYIKYVRTGSGDGAGELEAASTSAATTGNLFRYDATSGQYIFNWSTKGVTAGNYDIKVYTDAGYTNLLGSVTVEVKK